VYSAYDSYGKDDDGEDINPERAARLFSGMLVPKLLPLKVKMLPVVTPLTHPEYRLELKLCVYGLVSVSNIFEKLLIGYLEYS
jgi:hypothetical protein